MKQPLIIYEDDFHKLNSINWCEGKMTSVCFTDSQGVIHTAFDIVFDMDKEGYDESNDLLHLHLEQVVIADD